MVKITIKSHSEKEKQQTYFIFLKSHHLDGNSNALPLSRAVGPDYPSIIFPHAVHPGHWISVHEITL